MVHLKDSKPLDIARFTFSLGKLNNDKKKLVYWYIQLISFFYILQKTLTQSFLSALLLFSGVVTCYSILEQKTNMWKEVPGWASLLIFVFVLWLLGVMEGLQVTTIHYNMYLCVSA